MASATNYTTFSGSNNSGLQVGHNVGTIDLHQHLPLERAETPPRPSEVIPFVHDTDFVGRGAILAQIHERCHQPGSRTALVGFGGVGKSQLAIEYAHHVRAQSRDVWVLWVHASSPARFEQGYWNIANKARIFGRRDPRVNIFRLVHDWLQDERNKWFLILDNIDDSRFLRDIIQPRSDQDAANIARPLLDYIPQCANGSILITSRYKDAAAKLVERRMMLEVGPMSEIDAVALFEKKLGSLSDKDNASALAEALEYMPLAIVQAAAYISKRAPLCSVLEYLDRFRKGDQQKMSLLDYQDGELRRDREARNSIILTWQISFDYIRQARASAADLLSLMSFFDRQGIPEIVLRGRTKPVDANEEESEQGQLNESTDCDDGDSDDGDSDDGDSDDGDGDDNSETGSEVDQSFEDDVQMLRSFSFVSVGAKRGGFEMHRLVQLATRKWLEAHGQLQNWRHRFLRNLSVAMPTGEFENWGRCQIVFPHAKAAMTQRPKERRPQIDWASILHKAAWYAREQGNDRDAAEMAEQAMRVRRKVLGGEEIATMSSMALLGSIYSNQGQWKEAEELEVKVLETYKRVLGADHPDTLTCMGNLVSTFVRQSRYNEAEELNMQVMETSKKVLGADHPNTRTSMENLASIFSRQGRSDEAEELQVQVLENYKSVFGVEHPKTLSIMNNLASTWHVQARYDKAEELQIQVLETQKKVLGAEHPDTLISMGNLATMFRIQGRYDKAEELQIQVLENRKSVFGVEHPKTLIAMGNLGMIFKDQGRYDKAEVLQVQALETCKRVLGAEHPDTLLSMGNLAATFSDQGRYDKAEELEVQVLETRKKVLGAEHIDTLLSMGNLAFTWKAQGKIAEAINQLAECVRLQTQVIGANHPDTVDFLEALRVWRGWVEIDGCVYID